MSSQELLINNLSSSYAHILTYIINKFKVSEMLFLFKKSFYDLKDTWLTSIRRNTVTSQQKLSQHGILPT